MCHFITATLPVVREKMVRAIVQGRGIALRPLDNVAVRRQLRAEEGYYLTTTGHCDCGTPLGSAQSRDAASRRPNASS